MLKDGVPLVRCRRARVVTLCHRGDAVRALRIAALARRLVERSRGTRAA